MVLFKFHFPISFKRGATMTGIHNPHDNFQGRNIKRIPDNLINIRQIKHISEILQPHPF